jgi:hypothetical protein
MVPARQQSAAHEAGMNDRKSIITLASEAHARGKNIELWFDGELLFKIPRIEGESKDALALRFADALTEYAHANAPHVCPGCYMVDAPCAPGCIDAAGEERVARERELDDIYGRDDEEDGS